jgi:transposase-like protein
VAAILSNDPQERLNKEIRRLRADLGRHLPGPRRHHRLGGGALAEQNDESTESRRYIGPAILAACRKAVRADVGQNVTSEAESTVEAVLA